MRPPIGKRMAGEFQWGRVSSVDAAKHTARVHFADEGEDDDDVVSADLPVLVRCPGDYGLPVKDTLVLCAMVPGSDGVGWILGCFYSDADAPPLDDAGQRAIASDDLRLGAADATDKVALAPATKDEIQKALDYAEGIASAIQAGVPTPQDGGAGLKGTIVAALPVKPTLNEPAAENVSAK